MFDKLLRTLPNISRPKGMPLWKPRRRSRPGARLTALMGREAAGLDEGPLNGNGMASALQHAQACFGAISGLPPPPARDVCLSALGTSSHLAQQRSGASARLLPISDLRALAAGGSP